MHVSDVAPSIAHHAKAVHRISIHNINTTSVETARSYLNA